MGKYDQYHQEWIEKYKSGMSYVKIAKEYGCHAETVRYNIMSIATPRSNSESHLINYNYSEYYDEWVKLYLGGSSPKDIADKYGCGINTVFRAMVRKGISRSVGEAILLKTVAKHSDSDRYFDDLNNEGASYFLGLIVSDGCIVVRDGGRQQTLGLVLQEKDGYMVEYLANILGRNVYTCYPKGSDQTAIGVHIGSNYLVNRLRSYNITERKSTDGHIETAFQHIPSNMVHHYIRGIIDGDGCISNTKCYSISVCGNYYDLLDIANVFSSIECRKLLPRKISDNLYEVKWASIGDIKKIIKYLYLDATIYLERKKQKADEILNR